MAGGGGQENYRLSLLLGAFFLFLRLPLQNRTDARLTYDRLIVFINCRVHKTMNSGILFYFCHFFQHERFCDW